MFNRWFASTLKNCVLQLRSRHRRAAIRISGGGYSSMAERKFGISREASMGVARLHPRTWACEKSRVEPQFEAQLGPTGTGQARSDLRTAALPERPPGHFLRTAGRWHIAAKSIANCCASRKDASLPTDRVSRNSVNCTVSALARTPRRV